MMVCFKIGTPPFTHAVLNSHLRITKFCVSLRIATITKKLEDENFAESPATTRSVKVINSYSPSGTSCPPGSVKKTATDSAT